MNAHDPEFRRAFRKGKRLFAARGYFSIVRMNDGSLFPLPIAYDAEPNGPLKSYREIIVTYWNPDGTRWRRFYPEKILKKMQEGKHERKERQGL